MGQSKRYEDRANRMRVWEAAYAAAFVRSFEDAEREVGFDHSLGIDHAEKSIHIADAAVAQINAWIREGR